MGLPLRLRHCVYTHTTSLTRSGSDATANTATAAAAIVAAKVSMDDDATVKRSNRYHFVPPSERSKTASLVEQGLD